MEKTVYVLYNPITQGYLGIDGPEFDEYESIFGWSDYASGGILTFVDLMGARDQAIDAMFETGMYVVKKVTYKIENV